MGKQSLEKAVLSCLRNDCVMQSNIWACVRDAIHKDPLPFAQTLSIELEKHSHTTSKSFVAIMISKDKGSF